jgi:hypothetical protein
MTSRKTRTDDGQRKQAAEEVRDERGLAARVLRDDSARELRAWLSNAVRARCCAAV